MLVITENQFWPFMFLTILLYKRFSLTRDFISPSPRSPQPPGSRSPAARRVPGAAAAATFPTAWLPAAPRRQRGGGGSSRSSARETPAAGVCDWGERVGGSRRPLRFHSCTHSESLERGRRPGFRAGPRPLRLSWLRALFFIGTLTSAGLERAV